jgi:hypothetical protein
VGSPRSKTSIRREVSSLQTRLENKGKRITRISLAECLDAAFRSEATAEEWFENERMFGAEKAIEDVHKLLADRVPLVNLVADGMPHAPDPRKDVVLAQPVDNRSIQPDQALAALGLGRIEAATAKKPD